MHGSVVRMVESVQDTMDVVIPGLAAYTRAGVLVNGIPAELHIAGRSKKRAA
jgi:hypothetical protein